VEAIFIARLCHSKITDPTIWFIRYIEIPFSVMKYAVDAINNKKYYSFV